MAPPPARSAAPGAGCCPCPSPHRGRKRAPSARDRARRHDHRAGIRRRSDLPCCLADPGSASAAAMTRNGQRGRVFGLTGRPPSMRLGNAAGGRCGKAACSDRATGRNAQRRTASSAGSPNSASRPEPRPIATTSVTASSKSAICVSLRGSDGPPVRPDPQAAILRACHIEINPRLPGGLRVPPGPVAAAKGSGRLSARSLDTVPDTAFRPLPALSGLRRPYGTRASAPRSRPASGCGPPRPGYRPAAADRYRRRSPECRHA
jgi:hypothetical protein